MALRRAEDGVRSSSPWRDMCMQVWERTRESERGREGDQAERSVMCVRMEAHGRERGHREVRSRVRAGVAGLPRPIMA